MSDSVGNRPSYLSEMKVSLHEVQEIGQENSSSTQGNSASMHGNSTSTQGNAKSEEECSIPEQKCSLSTPEHPKSAIASDSNKCLEKWLQYESAVLPDENLRKECEADTYRLCLLALKSNDCGSLDTIACALHSLLSGGCLPADYIRILSSTMSEWNKEGIRPEYSEGKPTKSSLLELYDTVRDVLRQVGYPLAGEFTAVV